MGFNEAIERARTISELLYAELLKSSVPKDALIATLRKLNLSAEVLKDPVIITEINSAVGAGVEVLKRIQGLGPVRKEQLAALSKSSRIVYEGQIGATATELKSLLIRSFFGNISLNDLRKEVLATGLTPAQANSLVNETLNRFERSVTLQMGLNDGARLYQWSGPVDEKTSEEDLEIMAGNPYTLKEFENLYPGVAINGVHFNCRHFLEPVII